MPLPTIPSGNVASATAGAFEVANSCRFNDGDSAYLNRDLVTPTNADRWTYSLWVKRSNLGASQILLSGGTANDQADFILFRGTDDQLEWQMYHGTDTAKYKTTRVFRDIASWYHLVFTYDSANGTAGDRMRIYVNGTEETVFGTENNVAVNTDSKINAANQHDIGYDSKGAVTSAYFDGYMAEVVFCDGQAYAASDFGEFDEDSPTIWKPKDVSGLTFGNNGFYLDFEDSSNLGNDANGGTDWAETNIAATDQTTDTPTNNFATLNPLENYFPAMTFAEGNTQISGSGTRTMTTATIGLTAGKWYWESKFITNNSTEGMVGITSQFPLDAADELGEQDQAYGYRSSNGNKNTNNGTASYGDSFTAGDIIGVALDLDNLKVYFAKNGTWQDSGDPTTGATGTGAAFTITAVASTTIGAYFPAWGKLATSDDTWQVNFGNPTYANSSDAADADGYGAFEYAPPSGYFAICTKNLAEYGG